MEQQAIINEKDRMLERQQNIIHNQTAQIELLREYETRQIRKDSESSPSVESSATIVKNFFKTKKKVQYLQPTTMPKKVTRKIRDDNKDE